jgi:hypothetical protein
MVDLRGLLYVNVEVGWTSQNGFSRVLALETVCGQLLVPDLLLLLLLCLLLLV